MSPSVEPCKSTYGVLVCQDLAAPAINPPAVRLHRSRLWSGELVRWGDGCDETCTADCGWCKGRLRRDRETAQKQPDQQRHVCTPRCDGWRHSFSIWELFDDSGPTGAPSANDIAQGVDNTAPTSDAPRQNDPSGQVPS